MMGEEGAGCNTASGTVNEDEGAMEGIFQLENGDEIVIIEVSTSNLREGRLEREEEGEILKSSQVKYEGLTAEAKERSVKECNATGSTEVQISAEETRNGTISNSKEI